MLVLLPHSLLKNCTVSRSSRDDADQGLCMQLAEGHCPLRIMVSCMRKFQDFSAASNIIPGTVVPPFMLPYQVLHSHKILEMSDWRNRSLQHIPKVPGVALLEVEHPLAALMLDPLQRFEVRMS